MEEAVEARNDEDWQCLLGFLPDNWEQMAADTGALLRLRGFRATRSRPQPMIEAATTLKRHIDNIVTHARQQTTNALAENLNSNIEKIRCMACGLRNRSHNRIAIYFHCD